MTPLQAARALPALEPEARAERPALSRTVEFWLQTVVWTGLGMLACFVMYCLEKYVLGLRTPYRMFFNPAEISMRIFGLPHFIVGLMFMVSSRRMRAPGAWVRFALLLGMGIAFAYVFARNGAHRNPVMLIVFYFYFLIHGFRDEAYFYQTSGDCTVHDPARTKRVLMALQFMLISMLFAFLMPVYLLYRQVMDPKGLPADDPVLSLFFPASVPFLIKFACYLVPIGAANVLMFRRLDRRHPGGWAAIWRDYHPLMVVFLGSTGIVFATLFVGAWTFNFVVLAHFVGWYLFAMRKLQAAPPSVAPRGTLTWMRTTVSGFRTVHLGLALIVTFLIAVSVYGFGTKTPLDLIVGGPSFYYWTVLHVSLSFYPR